MAKELDMGWLLSQARDKNTEQWLKKLSIGGKVKIRRFDWAPNPGGYIIKGQG